MTEKEMLERISELGWMIIVNGDGEDIELENYSPAGEDLIVSVHKNNIIQELRMNYENFDAEEHAYNWYGKNRGEPSSLEILLEDAHAIEDMYRDLYVNVEEFLRRKDGQY